MHHHKKPSLALRLRVLSALDYAPGNSIRARIKAVSERTFADPQTGFSYQFTWRTISTWLYRHKKHGITTLDNKTRADKNTYRKVQVNELAEAISDVLPTLSPQQNWHHSKDGTVSGAAQTTLFPTQPAITNVLLPHGARERIAQP